MSFNHCDQSELTSLRQLGRRFAEHRPVLALFPKNGAVPSALEIPGK